MWKSIFSVVALSLLIFGCSSPEYANLNPPYTSNQENLDADNVSMGKKIQRQVDQVFPRGDIKVVADDFNILLIGEINTRANHDQLTKLVRNQRDVKQVWNYTTVSPNPYLDYNSSLVKKVQARIALEKNIDPRKVTVAAIGGTVYLLGTNIGNLTYLERSIRGIYTINGVNNVINLTTVGRNDYNSLESDSY